MIEQLSLGQPQALEQLARSPNRASVKTLGPRLHGARDLCRSIQQQLYSPTSVPNIPSYTTLIFPVYGRPFSRPSRRRLLQVKPTRWRSNLPWPLC